MSGCPYVEPSAKADVFVRGFTLGRTGNQRILDDDGSVVTIHAGPDDDSTQPSGDAGDRLACAVLKPVG
ncbi:superoxide dismutase family protein [Martelella sp. FOR1707]